MGILLYLIVRGRGTHDRAVEAARGQQQAFDSHVRDVSGASDPASQIEKAKALLDIGAIDQDETDALKRKALAG